jgi:hypothetical protein
MLLELDHYHLSCDDHSHFLGELPLLTFKNFWEEVHGKDDTVDRHQGCCRQNSNAGEGFKDDDDERKAHGLGADHEKGKDKNQGDQATKRPLAVWTSFFSLQSCPRGQASTFFWVVVLDKEAHNVSKSVKNINEQFRGGEWIVTASQNQQ